MAATVSMTKEDETENAVLHTKISGSALQIQRLNNFEMNYIFFRFQPTEAIEFQYCSFRQKAFFTSAPPFLTCLY